MHTAALARLGLAQSTMCCPSNTISRRHRLAALGSTAFPTRGASGSPLAPVPLSRSEVCRSLSAGENFICNGRSTRGALKEPSDKYQDHIRGESIWTQLLSPLSSLFLSACNLTCPSHNVTHQRPRIRRQLVGRPGGQAAPALVHHPEVE